MVVAASIEIRRGLRPILSSAAFSGEPDMDCWLGPAANLFAAASAATLAVIARASLAAGSAASQLAAAVAAVAEVGQAYPVARRRLPARLEFLLPLPDSLEVAAGPALPLPPRRASSSR